MAIALYLALTGAEFAFSDPKPERLAWMACHFSSYGTGLSNLPGELPPGSLLILNDRIPVCGHDPEKICRELEEAVSALACCGILLDLQRPKDPQTAAIVKAITALPFPIAVTPEYAQGLPCPVFLPPPSLHVPLHKHLDPWKGREIWLEAALDACAITVTPVGAKAEPIPNIQAGRLFEDETLHCHYATEIVEDAVHFKLYRTESDLKALLAEAEALGVTCSIGLYQELGK